MEIATNTAIIATTTKSSTKVKPLSRTFFFIRIAYQKNKETTDISIDARLETDNYAETKKRGITAPFITMQMARVTRRDFDGNMNVVTTVDQTAANSIEDAMAPGVEKLMCSTRQEMMEAVRKGKADAAFVYITWHRRL